MFTGTKPKVRRSLFNKSNKSETIPFSTDLPLLGDRSRPVAQKSKTFLDSATARRKAYVPSVQPYPSKRQTRSNKSQPLVERVDNPESILRKNKSSPWQKLRTKIENTPSLLTVITNLISPRSSIPELIVDTVSSVNPFGSVGYSNDLLATTAERTHAPSAPVICDNLYADGHTVQPTDSEHCLGATGGPEGPRDSSQRELPVTRPSSSVKSPRESLEFRDSVPVARSFHPTGLYPTNELLPLQRNTFETFKPDSNSSPKGTGQDILFPSQPQPERTPFDYFNTADSQTSPVTGVASDEPRTSNTLKLIREYFGLSGEYSPVDIGQRLCDDLPSSSPHRYNFAESSSHPVSCLRQATSEGPDSFPSRICHGNLEISNSRSSSELGCRPKVRFDLRNIETAKENPFSTILSPPVAFSDRIRDTSSERVRQLDFTIRTERDETVPTERRETDDLIQFNEQRESTCSAQDNLRSQQTIETNQPYRESQLSEATSCDHSVLSPSKHQPQATQVNTLSKETSPIQSNQFHVNSASDIRFLDPPKYVKTFRNIECNESDSDSDSDNNGCGNESATSRRKSPEAVATSISPRKNEPKIYNKRSTVDTMSFSNTHQMADVSVPPVGDLNDYQKGQRALTMLIQLPNFSGSPATRFDRWIKLFENIVSMSNWSDEEKVNMLITKMTDRAHDILQNVLESYTMEYQSVKNILHERFHGSETEDYYRKKFDAAERKPQETVLDFAFRLKTIFQRAYPPLSAKETASERETRHLFLRQKFLQGLDPSLRSKLRHKSYEKFEHMIRDAQKYSIRLDEDKDEKTKREFVNAVTSPPAVPELKEMVEAMKINNDTINAIATSLKFGNKPADKPVVSPPEATASNYKLLSDSIAKLIQDNLKSQLNNLPQNRGQFNNFPQTNRQQFPNQQFNHNPRNRAPFQHQQQASSFRPRYNSPPQPFNNFNGPPQPYNHFNGPPQSSVSCTYCGRRGHSQNVCRQLQKQTLEAGSPPICYTCRGIGHFASNCPSKNNRPNLPGSNRNQGNA